VPDEDDEHAAGGVAACVEAAEGVALAVAVQDNVVVDVADGFGGGQVVVAVDFALELERVDAVVVCHGHGLGLFCGRWCRPGRSHCCRCRCRRSRSIRLLSGIYHDRLDGVDSVLGDRHVCGSFW
jgi:hypothetical protein